MAVFTKVSEGEVAAWGRRQFGFAAVGGLSPIAEGIENTNYLLLADGRRHVLTIFEVWGAEAARYYAALTRHLAAKGAPVPAPLAAAQADGDMWGGKPCLLTPFVEGRPKTAPSAADCFAMGEAAAELHLCAADFFPHMPNPRGERWRRQTLDELRAQLSPETLSPAVAKVLQQAANEDAVFSRLPLPSAACHCDLFRNNVLWEGGRIAGIIDFYFGGEDALIFDLAVCACDWCFDGDAGEFSSARLSALLAGYRQRRMLCDLEERHFGDALQTAAFRFWVSRLRDLHFPREAVMLTAHDPRQFERIYHRARELQPSAWTKENWDVADSNSDSDSAQREAR